ncbi:MAG: phage integrase SAM-like domain-containing protein [Bacteroidota bacterium]
MAKLPIPKFNLRQSKSKTPTLISLVYRYRGQRLVYSTGYSIHPKDWDFGLQRPIGREQRPDLFLIQRALDDIASYCRDIFIGAGYGRISVEEFKSQLCLLIRQEELVSTIVSTNKQTNLSEDTQAVANFLDAEISSLQQSDIKINTRKMFIRHLKMAKHFHAFYNDGKGFSFDEVDWNLRLAYIDFLSERRLKLSTGNKALKTFRQFIEKARRKKLHSNTDYQGVGWTVSPKRARGQLITLSTDELDQLAALQIKGYLAKVRDICLIGAGTGQRFSDFSTYRPEDFYTTLSGIPILSIISTKTETPTKIPLNIFPWLIPVLERHGYSTPKMSMQKFNSGLKLLCEHADITERILLY